jgi:hypothetical protein
MVIETTDRRVANNNLFIIERLLLRKLSESETCYYHKIGEAICIYNVVFRV